MDSALQAQSTQRDRVSGGSRRAWSHSCNTHAGMLVASDLAGKFAKAALRKSYNLRAAQPE
eukprot:1000533-Prymnesium_polylepis.1